MAKNPRRRILDPWRWDRHCPETSARNYDNTLHKSPEDRSSQATLQLPECLVKPHLDSDLCQTTLIAARPTLHNTWCGRNLMRLATLCTNRQGCCLPLHMADRLTPAVDSVKVSTCYSCYAIVESVWSELVFVRCVTKMDRQKFEQRCAIKFSVKLWRIRYCDLWKVTKGLWRTFPIQETSVQKA